MEFIPRIWSLQSNPQVGWILLSLLVTGLIIYQRGRREDLTHIVLTGFFLCGTIGMLICLALDSSSFDMNRWMLLSGLFALMEMARWICFRLVAYIFEVKVEQSTMVSDYFYGWTMMSAACLILCLMVFAMGEIPGLLILMAAAFSMDVLWVLYKCVRQYIHSVTDIFFVLVGILTIEVLPVLFFASVVIRLADVNLNFQI